MAKHKGLKRYRNLLPASQQCSEAAEESPHGGASKRSRHRMTQVACDACRSRKTRCCGSRPVCEQCRGRNSECVYLSKDKFETRAEALKRECDTLRESTSVLQSFVDRLRDEPEEVAQAALARLRAERATTYAGQRSPSSTSVSANFDDQASDYNPAVEETGSIRHMRSPQASALAPADSTPQQHHSAFSQPLDDPSAFAMTAGGTMIPTTSYFSPSDYAPRNLAVTAFYPDANGPFREQTFPEADLSIYASTGRHADGKYVDVGGVPFPVTNYMQR